MRAMTSEFDREIASEPTGADTYGGMFGNGFTIGGGVNGGLLLAAVGRACSERLEDVGHTQPLTIAATYLSAAGPGPFVVTTDLVRQGRTSSVLRATLSQPEGAVDEEAVAARDGRADLTAVDRLTTLATFAAGLPADQPHEAPDGSLLPTAALPDIPPVEDCVGRGTGPQVMGGAPGAVELLERVDVRLDPRCAGFAVGRPSMRGVVQGWVRWADGTEPDVMSLLFMVDTLPPVSFDLGMPGWAPTVELTAYVRGVPAAGWLCVRHETTHVAGGHFEEDARVWDSAGRLVAQSRQLARLPRPLAGS